MHLRVPAFLATKKRPACSIAFSTEPSLTKTNTVSSAVLEDWVNVTEAYAAYTHPYKNELSYPAVTQKSKELLRHPVVEQLVMIGTRLAIPEQGHQKSTINLRWHHSRAVSEELPDSVTLGGLKSEITKWRR